MILLASGCWRLGNDLEDLRGEIICIISKVFSVWGEIIYITTCTQVVWDLG